MLKSKNHIWCLTSEKVNKLVEQANVNSETNTNLIMSQKHKNRQLLTLNFLINLTLFIILQEFIN